MKFDIKLNPLGSIKMIKWLTVVSLFTFTLLILSQSDTWAADHCSSIFTTSKVKVESTANRSVGKISQIFDPQISKEFWATFKEENFRPQDANKFLEDFKQALLLKKGSDSSIEKKDSTTGDQQPFTVQLNLFDQYLHYKFRYSVADHVGLRTYQSMAFATAFESHTRELGPRPDNSSLLSQYMREFGFNDKEIAFAKALAEQDYVGSYLRNEIKLETLVSKLTLQADNAGLPLQDFAANQLLYFTSHAYSNSAWHPYFHKNDDGTLVPRNFRFERIFEALKGSTNSGPQDYFYHVTPMANIKSIAEKGLIINYLPNWLDMAEPREYSKKGVFFSASLKRANTWLDLYKSRLGDKNHGGDFSNSLLTPTLIRTKARYDFIKQDELAGGAEDIIYNGDLRPENLEFWNGLAWIDMSKSLGELKPVTSFPKDPVPSISTSVRYDGVRTKSVLQP